MSGNGSASSRKVDRRVRRTRDALGDALVALMHEKPFAAITVQQVLDRAAVGRSTFYSHYRDKDDLFLSDAEDFFEGMSTLIARRGEVSSRVAAVCELFAHVAEWREFYTAMKASGKVADVMEIGQEYFARSIEQRLSALETEATTMGPAAHCGRSSKAAHPSTSRAFMAYALAGALFSLLKWWMDRGSQESPAAMDNLFHRMVWSGAMNSEGAPL